MKNEINASGNGENVVGGLNATDKSYLGGNMELLGTLKINDTS